MLRALDDEGLAGLQNRALVSGSVGLLGLVGFRRASGSTLSSCQQLLTFSVLPSSKLQGVERIVALVECVCVCVRAAHAWRVSQSVLSSLASATCPASRSPSCKTGLEFRRQCCFPADQRSLGSKGFRAVATSLSRLGDSGRARRAQGPRRSTEAPIPSAGV